MNKLDEDRKRQCSHILLLVWSSRGWEWVIDVHGLGYLYFKIFPRNDLRIYDITKYIWIVALVILIFDMLIVKSGMKVITEYFGTDAVC